MRIRVVEVPVSLGAGCWGAHLGPEALRAAEREQGQRHLLTAPTVKIQVDNFLDESDFKCAKHLDALYRVWQRASQEVSVLVRRENPLFLFLSGDHSAAYGNLSGLKAAFPDDRWGLIWIDAHADMHSPFTTPSGNVHGMPLALMLQEDNEQEKVRALSEEELGLWDLTKKVGFAGPKVQSQDVVFVGLRDMEEPERRLIQRNRMACFSTEDVRSEGAKRIGQRILEEHLSDCDKLYVSFDVDSLDPSVSEGTGTPVPGGLFTEEVRGLLQVLWQSPKFLAWEVVEIHPLLDTKNRMAQAVYPMVCDFFQQQLGR